MREARATGSKDTHQVRGWSFSMHRLTARPPTWPWSPADLAGKLHDAGKIMKKAMDEVGWRGVAARTCSPREEP
ncbi:MAG: hypothetical protein MZV70_42525 [Desulfobacterales bacterium]|nr:hypothetical protein [Desulfobacterales bacterium]